MILYLGTDKMLCPKKGTDKMTRDVVNKIKNYLNIYNKMEERFSSILQK